MSVYRVRQDAVFYRLGPGKPDEKRMFKDPARVDFRTNAELKNQLLAYARTKWPTARRIDIDLHSQQVIVDHRIVAAFAFTQPREHLTQQTGMSL